MRKLFGKRETVYISSLQKRMFSSAFLTAAFTEFTQIVAFTIDTLIVCSFFGEREVAAVGLAAPYFFLVGIPAACFSGGLQTVCSQEMGRGHVEEVSRRFSRTMLFVACLMAAATAALLLTVPQQAVLYGARGNAAGLKGLTSEYLYGLCLSAAPYVAFASMIPAAVLDNGSRTVVLSTVIGAAANVAVDLLTVVFGWGLLGIGLATAASSVVSLLVLLLHFRKKENVIRFVRVPLRPEGIGGIVRLGLPTAVHSAAGMLRSIILNALVVSLGGSVGMTVLALHGSITDFVDILPIGIAGAVGILAGISYGEMDPDEMEGYGVLAHRYILSSSILVTTVLLLFRRQIAGIFLDPGSEGFGLMQYAIVCIALGSATNAFVYSRVSYLQAVGKARDAQWLEASANFFWCLVLAFGLSVPFGVRGPFAAFPLAKVLVLAGIVPIYARRSGKRLPSSWDYLGLDERFSSSARDAIEYPVRSLEECALLSEQIGLFCRGHRLSRRTGYLAGLAAEEITAHAILSGGEAGSGDPILDVRVTASDRTLVLRVRDNGQAFNLSSLSRMASDAGDPGSNFGVRMICSLADRIDYYRVYGMNTTIIRITDGKEAAENG